MLYKMATANFGGYDYSFVDKNLDKFTCNICTKVLKDPHLTGCCGQHFCESCLNYWFTKPLKKSCPHCRAAGKKIQHLLDKKLKREIGSLRIHCSNKEEGCQWIGELESLKEHLNVSANGCGYVEVKCPNKCRRQVKRKDLNNHLKRQCFLRQYQCELCGFSDTYQNIINSHCKKCPEFPLECPNKCSRNDIKRKDMEYHRSQCPEEEVECPFEEAGCKQRFVRRELEQHMSSTQQQHLLLVRQFKMEIVRLKELNTGLKSNANRGLRSENEKLNKTVFVMKQKLIAAEEHLTSLTERNFALQQELHEAEQILGSMPVAFIVVSVFSLGVYYLLKRIIT